MGSSRTVLVVEDEPGLRDAIARTLQRRGYTVLPAADGYQAEALLAQALPDLVVVEMLLPGRSGLQVTRVAKERSDGRVPVVMLSGSVVAAHRDYALAVGVDAFLAKPCPPADLLAAAAGLCPLIPRPAPAPRPAAHPVAGA